MKNRKTNGLIRAILVCAALALAFGTGIYVTSLLEQKADPVQNEKQKENAVTEESGVTDAPVSDQSTDEYELPEVDVDSPEEEPDDSAVSSGEPEADITGYEPAETPEPASSGTESQPSSSETGEEGNTELPEVPVFNAP